MQILAAMQVQKFGADHGVALEFIAEVERAGFQHHVDALFLADVHHQVVHGTLGAGCQSSRAVFDLHDLEVATPPEDVSSGFSMTILALESSGGWRRQTRARGIGEKDGVESQIEGCYAGARRPPDRLMRPSSTGRSCWAVEHGRDGSRLAGPTFSNEGSDGLDDFMNGSPQPAAAL